MQSKVDRAKQFLPFDALNGFREAIAEKEKLVVKKVILSEEELEKLSQSILKINRDDVIYIKYYNKKEYLNIKGRVSKIDFIYKYLIIEKCKIFFDDILEIKDC